MTDYKQIVAYSRFSDFSGFSEDSKNDYRSSFLMGIDILLSRIDGGILQIKSDDYKEGAMVPTILLDNGLVCDSSILIRKETSSNQEQFCTYRIELEQNQKVKIFNESELTVEDAFSLFAFKYFILDDGEYQDIDEFYGYELS